MSGVEKVRKSEDIPKSLIRSADYLEAAETILQCRRNDLSSTTRPDLPKHLKTLAADEARIIEHYSVHDMAELMAIDPWLQIDEDTHELATVLDGQRNSLNMHRHRRKTSSVDIPDRAVQEAWAVRILDDAERAAADSDGTSTT
jgi:hypothetical protein